MCVKHITSVITLIAEKIILYNTAKHKKLFVMLKAWIALLEIDYQDISKEYGKYPAVRENRFLSRAR